MKTGVARRVLIAGRSLLPRTLVLHITAGENLDLTMHVSLNIFRWLRRSLKILRVRRSVVKVVMPFHFDHFGTTTANDHMFAYVIHDYSQGEVLVEEDPGVLIEVL